MISNSSIKNYNIDGVVVLRNIVNIKWINILKRGLRKNFQNPSKYKCVYEINNKKELGEEIQIQKTLYLFVRMFSPFAPSREIGNSKNQNAN